MTMCAALATLPIITAVAAAAGSQDAVNETGMAGGSGPTYGPSFGPWRQLSGEALEHARATPPFPASPGATANLRVTNNNQAQNETSIAVNPGNELIVVGGFNDYAVISSGFGGNGVAYSTDGGVSFTRLTAGVPLPANFNNAGGDPALAFDSQGRVYYAHLGISAGPDFQQNSGVFVARSDDGGAHWNATVGVATNVSSGGSRVNFEDKEYIDADRNAASAFRDRVYMTWTRFYEGNYPGTSTAGGGDIMLSHSDDGGQTWSAPIRLSATADLGGNTGTGTAGQSFVQGSLPRVGPDGSVYVAFHFSGRTCVRRSTDGGATFGAISYPFGNSSDASALLDHDGNSNNGVQIPGWTFRVNDFPSMAIDPTRPGYVYVVAADDPTNDTSGDGGDIIFARSTNFGASWSAAVKLNDDAGTASQVFPWIAVTGGGEVGAIWYDARNTSGSNTVDVYGTFSDDGGGSFQPNFRVTDQTFNPNTGQFTGNTFFGDYNGLAAGASLFYALWTDGRDGEQEIYFARNTGCGFSDHTAPNLTCPSDITIECSQSGGTPASDPQIVAFLAGATAVDACDPSPTVTNNAPGFFPDGVTTVVFTAKDFNGNTSTCPAHVTVHDTTPPTVSCPADLTLQCDSHCDPSLGGVPATDPAVVAWLASFSATDVCDPSPTNSLPHPPCFPLGDTPVTFTSIDHSGNAGSCTRMVHVVDTTPPTIVVSLDRTSLWPPNHKLVTINATVAVTDVCDPNPTFQLVSIVSSEPDNGLGDGDTSNDIQGASYGTPDTQFQLRSERSGTGPGRTYTITYRAFDHSGNHADAVAVVRVAHDQGAAAQVATGWDEDGTGFAPNSTQFAMVVRSIPRTLIDDNDPVDGQIGMLTPTAVSLQLDTRAIDVRQAYVGNTAGAVAPVAVSRGDVDGDGLQDLVCYYDVQAVLTLQANSTADDGPIGLHFAVGAMDYLVPDIFACGSPIVLPNMPRMTVAAGGGHGTGRTASGQAPTGTAAATTTPADAAATHPTSWTPPALASAPLVTELAGVYPNPVRSSARVDWSLAAEGRVELAIFDIRGARVRTLASGRFGAGRYSASWDGRSDAGRSVGDGIYFVRLNAGRYAKTIKTVMMP
jgi:hypothetical protein